MRPPVQDALRALDMEIDRLCEQVRVRALRPPSPVPDAPIPGSAKAEPAIAQAGTPRAIGDLRADKDRAGQPTAADAASPVAVPALSPPRHGSSRLGIMLALAILAAVALGAALMLV